MARARTNDDFNDNDYNGFNAAADDGETEYFLADGDTEAKEMAATREESPEARSPSARCRVREQLERDIQAYLEHGGTIHQVAQGTTPPHGSRYQDDYWNPLI